MDAVLGLSEAEAVLRRANGQGNRFDPNTSRTYTQILRYNIFNFINLVLFGIGMVLVLLGLPEDALVTAGLVLLNVLVGVVQEIRAKRKLDKIALLTRPKVTVMRDGQEKLADPAELVLGDVLVLRAGDQIAVDGTVIGEGRIEVDESLLTGESDQVLKQAGDGVYSGSFCVTGTAYYQAERVGSESFANRLTAHARHYLNLLTPLQRSINFIIRLLALITLIVGILIYIGFVRRGLGLEEVFQSLAVVIALIPQGLIFLTTLSYALAAVRIAGEGALVQKSSAVEAMSTVDVLCLDKTGTLTTNNICFHALHPLTTNVALLERALGLYVASATTHNRTSEALAAAFPASGRRFAWEIPFASSRKWGAICFDSPEQRGIYVLGAVEMLAPHLEQPGPDYHATMEQWLSQGLRVLMFAFAAQTAPAPQDGENPTLPGQLVPLSLLSLRDEVRPEARETLQGFAEAGIQVKIISGDHPQTVLALAQQAQFPGVENLLMTTGSDLSQLDDAAFAQMAEQASVFGRITPYQKEKLVGALQGNGHRVAMIGDGVNDVLSLKQAEVGIAMQSGSAATRNVADIVLLNDSFAVLPNAFMEGQRIINGMQDIARILLSRTFYVVFVVIGALLMGLEFPFTPRYDALIALLTVGIPGPALAMWARPGRASQTMLKAVLHFVLPAAATMAALGLGVYLFYSETQGSLLYARTALSTTMILCGLLLLPFVEPPSPMWVGGDEYSGDPRPSLLALGMFALFVIIMLVPGLRASFLLVPLAWGDYLLIGLLVLAWATLLRAIWMHRVFERLLGVQLS